MAETEATSSGNHPRKPEALRVAVFSDAMPERNGAGAYYADLTGQLGPHLDRIELFEPANKMRLGLALPLPGDSTQKLLTPNFPRLWKQFKELRPHMVVAVTPGPFGVFGLYLAGKYKTGFLTAFHTHFEELARMYFNPVSFWVMNHYLVGVNKRLSRKSATVLVNNSKLIPIVEKLGARKVDVVGTPLAMSFLRSAPKPPLSPMKRVLFAGRLAPEKNVPAVLEAARRLKDIEFVIAGDGPLRASVKKESASLPNITMTGWLNREELLKAMDEANVLLLPSKMETFGTVALESMARGRPAIVADGAGIHDWPLLKDGLISIKESDSLADLLDSLRREPPEFWNEKARLSRQAAEKLNEQTIDQWKDLLQTYAVNWTGPSVPERS